MAEGDDRAPAGVLEEGKPEEGLDTWAGGGGAGVGVAAGFDGVGVLALELELLEDCELDAGLLPGVLEGAGGLGGGLGEVDAGAFEVIGMTMVST